VLKLWIPSPKQQALDSSASPKQQALDSIAIAIAEALDSSLKQQALDSSLKCSVRVTDDVNYLSP